MGLSRIDRVKPIRQVGPGWVLGTTPTTNNALIRIETVLLERKLKQDFHSHVPLPTCTHKSFLEQWRITLRHHRRGGSTPFTPTPTLIGVKPRFGKRLPGISLDRIQSCSLISLGQETKGPEEASESFLEDSGCFEGPVEDRDIEEKM
ncbi:hypothetical protein AVEN_76511-1 [Araneus ventricosus]|uniref:Uncharacterized protein n=1 Tax=Araneus ventricosus TaxID=182803 RepID=A0A4Y2CGK9_ARAVE|nr:hypothetical protein AVEN_76511-1 [Araneus ventricosus]